MDTEDDRTYLSYFQNQQGKQQIETPSSTALAFHPMLKVVEGLIHWYLTLSEGKRDRACQNNYIIILMMALNDGHILLRLTHWEDPLDELVLVPSTVSMGKKNNLFFIFNFI